jgi:hypothetical protein
MEGDVSVGLRTFIESWPVYRQLTGTDPLGRGTAAQSPRFAPYATEWTELELDTAMDMVTDRVLDARNKGWQDYHPNGKDPKGDFVRRTMGIASLGGATLDNEENYLIKKLFTALGAIQIENQARI